ncbi:MAG: hypothetical protein LBJ00_00880, partial [Planctomycetaceae bacterium]|nr:hypothetical protein [Planctomycetaceae bacterium]
GKNRRGSPFGCPKNKGDGKRCPYAWKDRSRERQKSNAPLVRNMSQLYSSCFKIPEAEHGSATT